ncbi:MAG: GntR family transcriptional regulator [Vagococcus sp.]
MKKGKTQQLAYSFIKQKIDEGTWENGVKIIEQDISEELGISRTPLRDAIHCLIEEDYLIKEKNKGVSVSKRIISTKEFIERTQLLELILSNYLFQLQTKGLTIDWTETETVLVMLDRSLTLEEKQIKTSDMLKEFLKPLRNQVMEQIVIKNVYQLHYVEFPNATTDFLYEQICGSFKKLLAYLVAAQYDLARKEIRVFFNRLNLELIDNQF